MLLANILDMIKFVTFIRVKRKVIHGDGNVSCTGNEFNMPLSVLGGCKSLVKCSERFTSEGEGEGFV